MAEERVRVPVPLWTNEPLPLMAVEVKSVPWATMLERLNMSTPLFVIVLLLDREPVVSPLPIWRPPALIVVGPV